MTTRKTYAAALVGAGLLVAGMLSGCAPAASPSESPTRSAPAPSASTTASPTPSEALGDHEHEPDPAAPDAAVAIAVEAVTAYCRPGVAKAQWMDELSPLLTPAAVTAYDTVDPATVPCTTYTGGAAIASGDGVFTFLVSVPTDAGTYTAYVTRPDHADPWQVDRMAPPE
ncbi:hypothetical protein [Microbacterium imperiale]|uniref:hypothetical protein n=1 Tax=Microbacterium imperiale TaxID=33884 RepID=UPI001AEACFAC|nr:hypothetical protein [Microbacterium imperiale]MBP2422193.1 hypothetical protein [Microbacterium imperiale]MDS0200709.1 hypothetical protein [Microbacterium imperiale]